MMREQDTPETDGQGSEVRGSSS